MFPKFDPQCFAKAGKKAEKTHIESAAYYLAANQPDFRSIFYFGMVFAI
jgi:hypothetical protein